ncbi:MAG: hypothetical protein OEW15_18145, partial [Nitrospirota bacterium]|nr:hypothetical protein [Nitrospirota bacterium]
PAGASLGASNEYIAKPLEMEQRMRQSTACIDAGLSTQSYALPLITEWSDPQVGAEPTGSALLNGGAPSVVGGVVQ